MKKTVDKSRVLYYNIKVARYVHLYGGIAQLARAFGSYPKCRWFKSDYRYHIWPVGQAVKTPPFHGGNMGSIPVRVTIPIPLVSLTTRGFSGLFGGYGAVG